MNERKCPFCGFGIGNGTKSGKCPGCGRQVDPNPKHDKPAPGIRISNEDDDYIVSESDVERWPSLRGVIAVRELEYEYGRGIGAEPYGYHTTNRRKLIDIEAYVHAASHKHDRFVVEAHKDRQYSCPDCGNGQAEVSFSQDRAGIAGARVVTCSSCGNTLYEARWT